MNTILIVIDTLRRDHLGCYGAKHVKTPCLDEFAQRSVVFDNAYLASSPCMPARREIMTGRYEFPFRGWGPLEHDDCDLPLALSKTNHPSMLVTDHYHLFEHGSGNYHFHFNGWEFLRGQENDHWITNPSIPPRFPAPERTKCHFAWAQYMRNTAQWRNAQGQWKDESFTFCAQTFSKAAEWLEQNAGFAEKDFLLVIDNFDPHEPFDPPAPYDTMYLDGPPPAERVRWPIYGKADRYTPAELADIRALYAGKVTLVDKWFGVFMKRLEKLGRLNDTMVIVTTDHGHMFGEHGMIGKPGTGHGDSTLYQCMSHIPLLVYHPDFRSQAGSRRSALIQPVDYYPTVLEAAKQKSESGKLHGSSLLPLMNSSSARIREHACFGKFGEAVHITDGEWTLVKWPAKSDTNSPLHWYSASPPDFIKPRGVGAFERDQMRFPIDHLRGPMSDALFHLPSDPEQNKNLIQERTAEVDRLCNGMRAFFQRIDAPREQLERLGLA
jgi:arylsulfatase A-like enzyme